MIKKVFAGVNKKYPIIIGKKSILKDFLPKAVKNNSKILIVTDTGIPIEIIKSVSKILEKGSKIVKIHKVAKGEKSKSFAQFERIQNKLAKLRFDRTDCIIALGGGVVGDLAGYVASSYQRGVDFIQIPTTLLAQVDSSVGGKTAINLEHGKNLVGAFYNPKLVLICPEFLKTLSNREYFAGLAEVLKYGLIRNKKIFNIFETSYKKIYARHQKTLNELILLSVKTKAKIVLEDEKEEGVRAILNYGHTFGHALEAYNLNYKYSQFIHGEAVLVGMFFATELSYFEGHLKFKQYERVWQMLYHLDFDCGKPSLTVEYFRDRNFPKKMLKLMMGDKKVKSGKLNLVLIKSIGSAFITDKFSSHNLLETLRMPLDF
jgi:3-dehydroquinate synthase|tara:strand:- start:335 stop:1456 length:1122 start_codon:yes stop_codon:yes gene_type:complete